MVLSIIGSLELMSLVPGSWRLSASMVLQTTAFATLIYFLYRVVRLVHYVRWVNKVYGDMPGPKERHWFFGSFYYVSRLHRCFYTNTNFKTIYVPHRRGGGHIVFGADPVGVGISVSVGVGVGVGVSVSVSVSVGVGVTLSCLHDIS